MKAKAAMFVLLVLLFNAARASSTQQRIDRDIEQAKPLVIHVSVALADNKHQWIVPVPEAIGNGQSPANNLYWGARYGLKTFLLKDAGWQKVYSTKPKNSSILERLVLSKKLMRNNQLVQVYLVADAWDGRFITQTIEQFLRHSAGHDQLQLKVDEKTDIHAGGMAHLKVYIGHNALMDYYGVKDTIVSTPEMAMANLSSDAVVLACKSQPYFESRLQSVGAHSLVLTNGLMAPEAYTLDAAISAWVKGRADSDIRRSAAAAYAKYQKIGQRPAELLFRKKGDRAER